MGAALSSFLSSWFTPAPSMGDLQALGEEVNNSGPSSVQVFTHNITRRPISWDPQAQRPTQELVHSVHSALHFALDPCVNHPDEKPSFSVLDSPPLSSSSSSSSRLYVPSLDEMLRSRPKPSPSSKDKDELSVKLFAGFNGTTLTPAIIADAIAALETLCGPERVIDCFAISLDGVKWPPASASATATTVDPEPTREEVRQIEGMRTAWQVKSFV